MIKYLIVTILSVLLWTGAAIAAPYVVTNVYPTASVTPDYFSVTLDAGAAQSVSPQAVTGGVRLHYDIGSVSSGTHTVRIKACSTLWGCSSEFPFTFTKGVPAEPSSVSIEQ